jgi:ankyrin repeat protein
MAQLACNYGMKDYAANLFETSAATHHADLWALQAYQGWREWAVNNGPPPMFSDLHQAALDGDVEAIEAILAEGVDVDYVDHEGLTPLFYAVREEKRDAALALLQAGANPNAIVDGDNHTILWRAIQYSLKDMAALLMEHGGDLMAEYKPGEQLYFLLYYRDMQDLAERAIREFGVDVDFQSATGNTALRTAASEGDLDTVKWLLALGADIDVRTSSGRTPLSIAIDNEKEDVALYLIEQGADVTISASNGWSPLMGAADAGFINVVKALLARGADVRDEDDTGWTALHMAVMDGELEILKLLLDAPGADIDTITHERRTLIHQAAKSGHTKLIEFLIAQGVEVNPTTDVGKTPLDYAIEENKTEAAEYLESIGGVRGNMVEAAAAG